FCTIVPHERVERFLSATVRRRSGATACHDGDCRGRDASCQGRMAGRKTKAETRQGGRAWCEKATQAGKEKTGRRATKSQKRRKETFAKSQTSGERCETE